MKKLHLLAVLFFLVAFNSHAQIRFGLKAGANFTTITEGPTSGTSKTMDLKLGAKVGLVLEKNISSKIALQSGLLYTQQGAYEKQSDRYFILNYVELPVNFLLKPTAKFSVGAGPYVAYGISEVTKVGKVVSTKNNFGDPDEPEVFDYGVNVLAGYEIIDNWVIGANYSMGLANISQDKTFSRKLSGFTLSMTKFFGRKPSTTKK